MKLNDERQLELLREHHVLADEVVRQRFRYRRPGLFVLVVRVFALPQPYLLRETPEIAGCKSWVVLDAALSTEGAQAVQSKEAFEACRAAIVHALGR